MADDIRCPKCGYPTLLRCVKKGSNAQRAFYVCTQYPDCRGRIPIEVSSETIKHFTEAERLLESEEFGKAIIEFTKVINLDPTLETPYIYRAVCHNNLEQYQEAFYDYDKAIQINPHNPLSYMGRSTASKGLGENQQAIEDINKGIQLTQDKTLLAQAYLNRGVIYSIIQEYGKAIQSYNKSISLDPDERITYLKRSSAYDALGEHDKAQEDLDFILKLARDSEHLSDIFGENVAESPAFPVPLPFFEKGNPLLYKRIKKSVERYPDDNPALAKEIARYEAKKGKKGLIIIIIVIIAISYIIAVIATR